MWNQGKTGQSGKEIFLEVYVVTYCYCGYLVFSKISKERDETRLRANEGDDRDGGKVGHSFWRGAFDPRILPIAFMMCSGPKGLRMVEFAPACRPLRLSFGP